MIALSNPRTHAVIENWPSGANRVTATFTVEKNKRGERIARTTTGKPKVTTYHDKMAIVDGEDGRTYLIAFSPAYGFRYILSSDMQHQVQCYDETHNPEECKAIDALLAQV